MCSKYSRTTALLNRNISWTRKMLNWHIWTQYNIFVHYINLVALFLTLNKYLSAIFNLLTLANLYPMFHFYTPGKFWFSHVMTIIWYRQSLVSFSRLLRNWWNESIISEICVFMKLFISYWVQVLWPVDFVLVSDNPRCWPVERWFDKLSDTQCIHCQFVVLSLYRH